MKKSESIEETKKSVKKNCYFFGVENSVEEKKVVLNPEAENFRSVKISSSNISPSEQLPICKAATFFPDHLNSSSQKKPVPKSKLGNTFV